MQPNNWEIEFDKEFIEPFNGITTPTVFSILTDKFYRKDIKLIGDITIKSFINTLLERVIDEIPETGHSKANLLWMKEYLRNKYVK